MAQSAPAQNVNSGWNFGGGTGIGRHATGFSGTSGDPLYQENRAPGQTGVLRVIVCPFDSGSDAFGVTDGGVLDGQPH